MMTHSTGSGQALSLGATLIALRQQHGWNLAQAAHATGTWAYKLQAYETDRLLPPLATLKVIATAYGADLDQLVKLAVPQPLGNGTP